MGSLQEQLAQLQADTAEQAAPTNEFHSIWQAVGLDPEDLDASAPFRSLGLEDLDIFEIAIRSEQQFGKQVDLSEIRSWNTLQDVMDYFS